MADVLSQSELESLLSTLDPQAQDVKPATVPSHGDELRSSITVYDFKRPERVSKEQMRAFQALHDGFSREFGAAMSGMLRSIIEVKLISVDQLTFSEFIFSLENPTCLNLMHSAGLDGHVILDLNPTIIFPIVDRLLGGGKAPRPDVPKRPLTEIELKLVSRITKSAIDGLEKSWKNICDLKLEVSQVESNPQLVQIVPPNEVVVLISFEIVMGETRGIMNLCIPFNTIEPLAGKLSSDTWATYTKRAADARQKLNLEAGIGNASVEMVVRLADTDLSAQEVMNLSVGDVIMTEKSCKQGLNVFVEDRPMFLGYAGLIKGHKAVRISETVSRPEDLVEQQLGTSQPEANDLPPAEPQGG